MGGIGAERDVSIQSGTCVAEALTAAGYDVVTADVRPDQLDILEDSSIDIFFPALHGEFGEDGKLQQIFEAKGLVYAGSGPAASDLAFDKMAAKEAFIRAGVLTPASVRFDPRIGLTEGQARQFAGKCVVKPIRQGSSVGVSIVSDVREAVKTARRTAQEFGDCMIEEFIAGRELTVGILCDEALPIIEIRTKAGFYDYHAKYVDEQTQFLFDTVAELALARQIQSAALDCFVALGCRDFARVDFILGRNDRAYVLEVNTIPGFTSHSLLPKAAAKAGLSMSDLCARIVEAAIASAGKGLAPGAQ
ncbi:MAG: D-alanine--D-alanine ligase [Sedimentisphaerales bacterium]|nr:D-alanine--D-alanine ligase [Sedimentisphaerales bacterium]